MKPDCGISGRRASSGDLTNKETNRVVTLFKLLTDPDDLDAVMDRQIPNARRLAEFHFVSRTPDG